VHAIMDEEGMRLPVIAKIEKPQAVDNLEEIIEPSTASWSRAVTSAWNCPLEEVPLVQKRAIEIARRNAKPVIVATQVLESMIENSAADPCRGLRCRQCRARRCRRADALGRDVDGCAPVEAVTTMAGSSRTPRTTD
jgi:pyruvate kinase